MLNRVSRFFTALIFAGWLGSATAGPITDIITVNGTEWAQVDLFVGLSWSDINNVCPGGVCGNGTLQGFDMLGWTWASTEELNSLFNYYLGNSSNPIPNLLGPGPDSDLSITSGPDSYAQLFFADGWRATSSVYFESRETMGRGSDNAAYFAGVGLAPNLFPQSDVNIAGTDFSNEHWNPGAWFSRSDPAAAVPSPATLTLMVLGLAALGHTRRKRGRQH